MIPQNKKYFVYPDCVDGRKSFNGLSGIVRSELGCNPAGGDVYVFVSSGRRSLKLLFWEHGGFVIYHKKMDKGDFEVPPLRADGQGRYISEIQLLQNERHKTPGIPDRCLKTNQYLTDGSNK